MANNTGFSDCWTYPKEVIDEKLGDITQQYDSIQAAGEAAIAAVEEAGEDVLESIPEDYTQLSEDVSGLKADFTQLIHETSAPELWYFGAINYSTGIVGAAQNFLHTDYLPETIITVKVLEGYRYFLLAYESDGTYVGEWNGSVFTKSNATGLTDPISLKTLGDYKFKLCLARSAETAIYMPEATNVVFGFLTDATLTETGKSADAKTTGDAVNVLNSAVFDTVTDNIIPALTWNSGYLKIDGTTASNTNFRYCDSFTVSEGDTFSYSIHGYNNTVGSIVAYDENNNFLKSDSIYYDRNYGSATNVIFSGTYKVRSGVAKLALTLWNNQVNNDYFSKITKESKIEKLQTELDSFGLVNQWENKKWVAFGSSITDNYSQNSYITQGEHTGEHTGKYVPYLLDMSELSESAFVNRGISGGCINGHILYYIRYYTTDEATADLITIEGAVNDFASDIPLGQVGDTVPYTNSLLNDSTADGTFAGACYQAFTTALTNAPNAVVVLLTETTGKNHVGYANYSQTRKNNLGLYQRDYIDMTIAVAKFVGIPVIECGSRSMINAQNPQYIADHIHHTYLGGYQYAKTIWAELKNIPLKAINLPE